MMNKTTLKIMIVSAVVLIGAGIFYALFLLPLPGDEYEANVSKANSLPLEISRTDVIAELGFPVASMVSKNKEYEVLYFNTPQINSEEVAAVIESNSQKVVIYRPGEGVFRAVNGLDYYSINWDSGSYQRNNNLE